MNKITIQTIIPNSTEKTKTSKTLIPAIIYNKKINLKFYLDNTNVTKIKNNINFFSIIYLNINNKIYKTIIKEIQYHPISEKILHIDFYKFDKNQPIVVNVPIKIKGRSIGVSKGGVLIKSIKQIQVKGLTENIPKTIHIDISNLDIKQKFLIQDIKHNNYIILNNKNSIIVSIKPSKIINNTENK